MDTITIHQLQVETFIGVYAWEQQIKQPVHFDLTLGTDIQTATVSDDIEDALNYADVAQRITEFTTDHRCQLVETLAHRVANLIFETFPVHWLKLTVTKPQAIENARAISVTIERRKVV
ncbi:MAG: dihydroneopterin aldolase [Legionellales bacterium]|nr:dihydroneopterin aldolase [Legionellales bacterium]